MGLDFWGRGTQDVTHWFQEFLSSAPFSLGSSPRFALFLGQEDVPHLCRRFGIVTGLHPTGMVIGGGRSGHRLHPFEAAIPGGEAGERGSPLLSWTGAGGTGLVLWALFSRLLQLVSEAFCGWFCPHPGCFWVVSHSDTHCGS